MKTHLQTDSVASFKPLPSFATFSLKPNAEIESDICDRFTLYADQRSKRGTILHDPKTGKKVTKTAFEDSRYHEKGQRKIKRKIHRALGHYQATCGIHNTLTFAGDDTGQTTFKGCSRPLAWADAKTKITYYLDRVNKLRRSRGWKSIKYRIWTLEAQPGRLYPHYHIWFPDLKSLADIEDLQRIWPYGSNDIKYRDNTSPESYIIDYISKMEGEDFFHAMIWEYRLRLYGLTNNYAYAHIPKPKTTWRFAGSFGSCSTHRRRVLVHVQYILDSEQRAPPPGGS